MKFNLTKVKYVPKIAYMIECGTWVYLGLRIFFSYFFEDLLRFLDANILGVFMKIKLLE